MLFSICVIDDKIPAEKNETLTDIKRLNSSNLSLLMKNDGDWEEAPLLELIRSLLKLESWTVDAFKHPEFYIKSLDDEFYRPDVIIYDWDFGGTGDSPETYLKNIIEKTFNLVSIYSGAEMIDEITKIVDDKFSEHKSRIKIIDKTTADSYKEVINFAESMQKENFSSKFGRELRKTTLNALESILVELGKIPLEQALKLLCSDEQEGFNEEDLKELIKEKLQIDLGDINFSEVCAATTGITPDAEKEIAKKLWSYRLYYQPSDNKVRKGDIVVENSSTDYAVLLLVISADCDLSRVWNKNLGQINVIKLYSLQDKKDYVKELGQLTRNNDDLKKITITSFVNPVKTMGGDLLYMPFIQIDGTFNDYIAFPKEIHSVQIYMPEDIKLIAEKRKRDKPLLYSYWNDYRRIATISEPFLTPTVAHILSSIAGYGTPDYPPLIKETLAKNFKEIF